MLAINGWRRLTVAGRFLFATPIALVVVAVALASARVPGASILAYVAFAAMLVALTVGVVNRRGMTTAELSLLAGSVDPTFVRAWVASESVDLAFDGTTLTARSSHREAREWDAREITTAKLMGRDGTILTVVDRYEFELVVQIDRRDLETTRRLIEALARQPTR